jgi:anaerobic ribonucleoside-triphosphate reductase
MNLDEATQIVAFVQNNIKNTEMCIDFVKEALDNREEIWTKGKAIQPCFWCRDGKMKANNELKIFECPHCGYETNPEDWSRVFGMKEIKKEQKEDEKSKKRD